MPEPTTIVGLILSKEFVTGIIGSLVSSTLYDQGKGVAADLPKLLERARLLPSLKRVPDAWLRRRVALPSI